MILIKHLLQRVSKFQSTHLEFNALRKYSSHKLIDLADKVSVVIGGVSDVGFAIANELLANRGKHVFITSPTYTTDADVELSKRYGAAKVTFYQLDQQNTQQYEELFCLTNKKGGTDIFINLEEIISDIDWEREIDVNMKGMIQGTLMAMKYAENPTLRGLVVINFASTLGLDGFPYIPVYAGTKAGIVGFSRSMGDYAISQEANLRVITVCPGIIDSKEFSKIRMNQFTRQWGVLADKSIKKMPKLKPEDIGRAVIYLIQYGMSGSVWVLEGDQMFRAQLPERNSISEEVACFSD